MQKIEIENKLQIKQLLYSGCILGIKGSQFQGFGGFQLWWYDKQLGTCHFAESHWADRRRQVKDCRFNKAVQTLWSSRMSVFLSTKHIPPDNRPKVFRILGHAHQYHGKGTQ